jgi:hypothetical protein
MPRTSSMFFLSRYTSFKWMTLGCDTSRRSFISRNAVTCTPCDNGDVSNSAVSECSAAEDWACSCISPMHRTVKR